MCIHMHGPCDCMPTMLYLGICHHKLIRCAGAHGLHDPCLGVRVDQHSVVSPANGAQVHAGA